jgi:hypothetical protein
MDYEIRAACKVMLDSQVTIDGKDVVPPRSVYRLVDVLNKWKPYLRITPPYDKSISPLDLANSLSQRLPVYTSLRNRNTDYSKLIQDVTSLLNQPYYYPFKFYERQAT